MTRRAFSPVKPCPPELPKAAVRRLFDQAGGIDRVAIRLGIKPPTAYALADAGVPDEISFARVAALTGPDAPAAAEYLAGLAGGFYQPVDGCDAGDAQRLTSDAARAHGEAMAVLISALADGKITPAEARAALVEIDESLRAHCQVRALLLAAMAADKQSTD